MERIRYPKWKYVVMAVFCFLNAVILCYLVFGDAYDNMFMPIAGWAGLPIGWGIVSLISLRIGMPKPVESGGWKRLSDAIITIGGTAIVALDIYWLYDRPLWLSTWLLTGMIVWIIAQLLVPRWRNNNSPLQYASLMAVLLAAIAAYFLFVHPMTTEQALASVRGQGYYPRPWVSYCRSDEQAPVGCYLVEASAEDGKPYRLYLDVRDSAVLRAEPVG